MRTHQERTEKFVLLLLSFLAFDAWLITIASTQIHSFPPSAFYYAESLPLVYWIGMALLVSLYLLLLFGHLDSHSVFYATVLCTATILLVLYTFGTADVIYDNPRYRDVLEVIADMASLVATGRLNLTGSLDYAAAFPGALILFHSVSKVTGLTLLGYARLHSSLIVLGLCLAALAIWKRISGSWSPLIPLAVVAFAWPQEIHMAPQSVGLLLLADLLLALVLYFIGRNGKRKGQLALSAAFMLATAGLVVVHPGSPFVLIASLLFVALIALLSPALRANALQVDGSDLLHRGTSPLSSSGGQGVPEVGKLASALAIALALWLAWLMYVAQGHFIFLMGYLNQVISNLLQGSLSLYDFRFIYVSGAPQADFQLVDNIRILLAAFEYGLSAGIVLFALLRRRSGYVTVLAGWLLGAFSVTAVGVFTGGGFTGRALIFVIVPLAAMLPALTNRFTQEAANPRMGRRQAARMVSAVFAAILLCAAALVPLTVYGADAFEFTPDSAFALNGFVSKHSLNVSNLATPYALDFAGPAVVYECYIYNGFQLKVQYGVQYKEVFSSPMLDEIYDSGCSTLYVYHP